jgi:hypothetical protein
MNKGRDGTSQGSDDLARSVLGTVFTTNKISSQVSSYKVSHPGSKPFLIHHKYLSILYLVTNSILFSQFYLIPVDFPPDTASYLIL